jgi:integrase
MRLAEDCRMLGVRLPSKLARPEAPAVATLNAEINAVAAMLTDDGALQTSSPRESVAEPPKRGGGQVSASENLAPLFSVAAQKWVEAHSTQWAAERRHLCQTVIRDFFEIAGDKPIGTYRKSEGLAFLELLQQLPANLEKRRHKLGIARRDLREIAARAKERGAAPQHANTVRKKLGILKQCFSWLSTHYDGCERNPIEGLQVAGRRRNAKEQKDVFSVDQLNLIFSAPVFTGCKSERHWGHQGSLVLRDSAKFWVPLIGLFGGMRLDEICQLSKAHVCQHAGVHYFALTRGTRLKSDSSIRSVPIHQMLIDCGFLAFVARCQDRLFPDLKEHVTGRHSDSFSKHFHCFLERLGIKRPGLDFHSLRHTFAAAALSSGLQFDVRERLMGHGLPREAGRYGMSYPLEQQDMALLLLRNAELQKLRFNGLQLEHLRIAKDCQSGG